MRRQSVVGVLALLLCACSPAAPEAPGTPSVRPRGEPVSSASRDLAFPADTLEDWVSYGDRVVAVEVVAEAHRPTEPGPDPQSPRWRDVTWRNRGELWANPARPDEPAPRESTASGGVWTSDRADAGVEAAGGDPVLYVGHTYAAVLTLTRVGDAGPREWITLAMLPFDDGVVGDGEEYLGWEGQEATLDAVWGRTGPELAAILSSTPVDPDVVPYADRDASERWQLSSKERHR